MAASPSSPSSSETQLSQGDNIEQSHPFYICMVECKEPDCKHQFCLKLHKTEDLKGLPEGVEVICSGAFKTLEKAQLQYKKMEGWKHVSIAAFKRQMLQESNANAVFRSVFGELFFTVSVTTSFNAYIHKYNSQPKTVEKDRKRSKRSEKEKKAKKSKKSRK